MYRADDQARAGQKIDAHQYQTEVEGPGQPPALDQWARHCCHTTPTKGAPDALPTILLFAFAEQR